jgi:hypothetical protein
MISVIITKQNGAYKSFICSGHAEFSPDSKSLKLGIGRFLRPQGDVVCAGVSAIVINTVNCLQDLLHEDIGCDYDSEEGGLITCVFRSIPTHEASLLIDSMIHGLTWIRGEYGERYLKFEIEEV